MLVAGAVGVAAGTLAGVLTYKWTAAHAVCTLDGEAGVRGTIRLFAEGDRTRAECHITGLAPGLHGLHVHRCGDVSGGCATTCEHYNPDGTAHGGPLGTPRHRGDFGNVVADADGVCTTVVVADVTLREIVGRAFVVHADPDDCGKGGDEESARTGNAGARLACGVVVGCHMRRTHAAHATACRQLEKTTHGPAS